MAIRSDKMRPFTREESDWFWEVMKIKNNDQYIPFPEAWKYFDAGLTAEQTVKIYATNDQRRSI